jgi:YtoQ family protein
VLLCSSAVLQFTLVIERSFRQDQPTALNTHPYAQGHMEDLTIYLAGEIHSDWREQLRGHIASLGVPADFDYVGPQEAHQRSDDIGEDILGDQPGQRYRDLMGGKINNLRRRVQMNRADLVVAYFGPEYKQWNTAADVGAAAAMDLPVILVRDPQHVHALKDLDAFASITVETLEQAAQVIAYIFE